MLARMGNRWRTLLEWLSAEEWAPHLLRLPRPKEEGFRPGLLLIELSGCDRDTWEWARARGGFPFLTSLCSRENHVAHDYHAGPEWSRAAREAELFHGVTHGLPGDAFYSAEERGDIDFTERRHALHVAAHLENAREGLLAGGSAWGSLIAGGSAEEEFHPASTGSGPDGWATWLRRRLGASLDLRRGLPIVYWRGECAPPPDQDDAHRLEWWRRQDARLAPLYHRARRARRRDYETWVLLTPEQRADDAFPADYAERLRAALTPAWTLPETAAGAPVPSAAPGAARALRLLARGPVAHLYAERAPSDTEKARLAHLLVQAGGTEAVLWCDADGKVRRQRGVVPEPWELAPPPGRALVENIPTLRVHEAAEIARHPGAGHWVILREVPRRASPPAAAVGVALLPPRTRLGGADATWLRPRQIYRAARHVLEREPIAYERAPAIDPVDAGEEAPVTSLRIATYNVHRCIGMDGRQSVRRVLRVVADLDADFIALQEVSAIGMNQAEHLAAELGMKAVFCPTLHGDQAYGHGLLSRHPFTVNAVGLLPLVSEKSWKEPRGAIWIEASLGGRRLHLVSTHLALGQADRTVQVDALLGPSWIGGLPADAPIILTGDFNFAPGGKNYRRISRRLRDAQLDPGLGPPQKTFSSICLVTRLDHVFLSRHFEAARVHVPRTDLTRVASDHFPLIVDLRWPAPPVAAESRTGALAPMRAGAR